MSSSSESYVNGCDNCDAGAGEIDAGLLISPEFRGGGGFGGSSCFAGLVEIDPAVVFVLLGGGMNLSFVSAANADDRN